LLILGIGFLLLLVQPANALPALVFGGILTVGVVFERWRYKQPVSAQAARGQPTGERFVDPKSGALTEGYYDATTGERSYVQVKDSKRR
jgi:hypothetical protein